MIIYHDNDFPSRWIELKNILKKLLFFKNMIIFENYIRPQISFVVSDTHLKNKYE